MRRALTGVVLAGSLALGTSAASAQASIHIGGGGTFPMRDYGDFARTGWLAHGGVAFPIGSAGLNLGAAGYLGSNGHDLDGDKTNLYGGLGFVQYAFRASEAVSPFVFGTAGLMVHSYESESQPAAEASDTAFAAGGGAGVGFPLGSVGAFVEGWLLNGFFEGASTTIAGLTAGLQFAVGGGM